MTRFSNRSKVYLEIRETDLKNFSIWLIVWTMLIFDQSLTARMIGDEFNMIY